MLVSPLLAAAALAQTVGHALGYQHIAMLFVEAGSATLAVVASPTVRSSTCTANRCGMPGEERSRPSW